MSQGTVTDSGGYFPSSLALTINDQPVENRRQLVGAKTPRRSTEDSPQSTGCLTARAESDRQRHGGTIEISKVKKTCPERSRMGLP